MTTSKVHNSWVVEVVVHVGGSSQARLVSNSKGASMLEKLKLCSRVWQELEIDRYIQKRHKFGVLCIVFWQICQARKSSRTFFKELGSKKIGSTHLYMLDVMMDSKIWQPWTWQFLSLLLIVHQWAYLAYERQKPETKLIIIIFIEQLFTLQRFRQLNFHGQ